MDLAGYLDAARQRLVWHEDFTPAENRLPPPLRAYCPVLLARRPRGWLIPAELLVALVPDQGLTPGEREAVLADLADLARWHTRPGGPAAVVVAAFVFPAGVTDADLAHLAGLKHHRMGREAVLPWAVDLPGRAVYRHQGLPMVPPLRSLADFTPLMPTPDPSGVAVLTWTQTAPPLPYITLALLTAVVLTYLWLESLGGAGNARVLVRAGANFAPLVLLDGEYWRLGTALFLHAGVPHILGNGLVLFHLGRQVEVLFGHWRFLFIYGVAGLAGGLMSAHFGRFGVPSVGASGAIFGLFGAMVYYRMAAPGAHRMPWGALLWPIALNLSIGLVLPFIDNWAHVGGLLGGLLAAVVAGLPPRIPRWRLTAVLAVALAGALLLAGALPFTPPARADLDRGEAALAAGDLGRAEVLFRRVQARAPEYWRPHYLLARVFDQAGRRPDALAAAQVARSLNPRSPEVLTLLIRLEQSK